MIVGKTDRLRPVAVKSGVAEWPSNIGRNVTERVLLNIMDALLNDPTTNKGWKFCG